ncbi:MAG: YbjN domain-containing protein [Rhodobacteraceae bacterium]|nr:YbjN domain-containing protein [Paracoccaceae bacterium]
MQYFTAFALAGAFALAAPAAAQILDHADPQVVADVARGYGSVELDTDAVGDPFISGRIEGTRYVVWFFGCTDNANCKTLLMSAYWDGSPSNALQLVNDWNRDKLFGRAYVDSDGDLTLDQPLTLAGGVTRANLDDWFDWWRLVLREFGEHVAN